MWLRSGIAVAVAWDTAAAPVQPLAWELPYAAGVAVKKKKIIIRKSGKFIETAIVGRISFLPFFF